jgi:hypothetical protein
MARDLLDSPTITLGNINNFSLDFKVTQDEFMVGLMGVKGLGKAVLNKIKKHYPSESGWLDYTEFMRDNFEFKMVSENDLKMLISLGMFDELQFCGKEFNRKSLVALTEVYYALSKMPKRDLKKVCVKLWDDEELKFFALISGRYIDKVLEAFDINTEDDYTETEIVNKELAHLGFRVTENIAKWQEVCGIVKDMGLPHISDFDDESDSHDHVWLTIRTVEMLKTKKGKPYANVRADDGSSFRVWHNKLQYCEDDLIPGKVLIVKLNADTFGRSISWDRGALVGEEKILKLQQEM